MAIATILTCGLFSCRNSEHVSAQDRKVIADSLATLVREAYDLTKPDIVTRLLSLYPDSGRVISASAGQVITTRQSLAADVQGFWQRVGRNMQSPRFVLGSQYVDILSPEAAVMTFTYSIPHKTPEGAPHVVGGAWTTLWRKQGGRWLIVQEHLSDAPETIAPQHDTSRTH